ncbi:MAG: hypothetical protein E6J05_16765 [Chloroflexi bacterium]|nr:MAG: hypothetical protein E6J05_16765 [Chloroflexota bacterium]
MVRLIALAVALVLASVCQSTPQPVPTPTPSPSPHTAVADAVLHQSEVPNGLNLCAGSGPFDAYITNLQSSQPELAGRLNDQWLSLRTQGATGAAISLYSSDDSACTAELASISKSKSAAAFVAVFADEGQADRAWQTGVLGFTPPAPGELPPGLSRGTPTGLGPSAWTYDRSPVRMACWHNSVFVALVVLTNLDLNAFRAATAAVNARLN